MRRTIKHEIVLAFEREHCVDQIVPRALLAELDLKAVGEKGKQMTRYGFYMGISKTLEAVHSLPHL